MVGFFSSSRKVCGQIFPAPSTNLQRQSNYQGFAKYNHELNSYNNLVAGVPSTGTPENSVSVSAGSAAVAALRLHQLLLPNQPKVQARRANSLSSNTARANSLRTYTYNPKPSYVPGQASIPNARRYNSLSSRSGARQFQGSVVDSHNNIYNKRVSSLNSQLASRRPQVYEEHDDPEGDIVITTQTTRVVDSQGRTQSITTKTTKTLPDGSNIIETTTKNISRSNSRSNSIRNSSLLNSPRDNAYNLSKIDEDLQGFEYNYEIDNPLHHQLQHQTAFHDFEVLDQDTLHNQTTLKLNTDHASVRSASITSNKSPQKPLKSILKHTPRPTSEQVPTIKPDTDETQQLQPAAELEPSMQHAYRKISGKPLSEPPKVKVPEIPGPSYQNPSSINSLINSPISKNDEQRSNSSIVSPSSHSIMFSDKVETFPVYDTDFKKPKQPISNQELYTKAMEVALKKVYGSTEVAQEVAPKPIPESVIHKKDKVDQKINHVQAEGIDGNYRYENHHKDFAIHSLRDDSNIKASSRKERAKEEKKQRKEEEKRKKEEEKRMKEEEKRAKEEAKKETKREAKESKKSPLRGIFARRRTSVESKLTNTDTIPFSVSSHSPVRMGLKVSRTDSRLHRVTTPTSGEIASNAVPYLPETTEKDFNGVKPSYEKGARVTNAVPESVKQSLNTDGVATAPVIAAAVTATVATGEEPTYPTTTQPTLVSEKQYPNPDLEAAVELKDFTNTKPTVTTEESSTPQIEPNLSFEESPQLPENWYAAQESLKSPIEVPVLHDVDSDVAGGGGALSEDDLSDTLQSPTEYLFKSTSQRENEEPEVTKHQVTEDGLAKPATETIVPEPEVAVSEITRPEVADLGSTQPELTKPEVAEFELTKPKFENPSNMNTSKSTDGTAPVEIPGQFVSEPETSTKSTTKAHHSEIKNAEAELHDTVVTPVQNAVTIAKDKVQSSLPNTATKDIPSSKKPSNIDDPTAEPEVNENAFIPLAEVKEASVPPATPTLGLGDPMLGPSDAESNVVEQNLPAVQHNIDEPPSRSNPPSDCSDDRSVQPSHSTVTTREEVPVIAKEDKTSSAKAPKPKKVSKFKEKLYKYFVNSYDKQRQL